MVRLSLNRHVQIRVARLPVVAKGVYSLALPYASLIFDGSRQLINLVVLFGYGKWTSSSFHIVSLMDWDSIALNDAKSSIGRDIVVLAAIPT